MRYLILLLSLSGCAVQATEQSNKPRGEEVFNILLKNGGINLVNEPLCKANINLNEQLSLAFSVSYENKNKTVIKSHCSPSKHDFSADKIIDVWDCTIQINENGLKNEFISSSVIVFSLTVDTKEFVKGSLRCR